MDNNKTPSLCLNMIVKNESNIIRRLFDSVISIIDTYCICDTGSTDNTVKIIEEYFKEKGIYGKIVFEPFKNFCHNRNFALKSCLGMSDFVLLLDADMTIKINKFNKIDLLKADSFNILQGNDSFFYQNMRIVKNNGLYKYVGVTHEYIDSPQNNTVLSFDKNSIFINDIGDGGSKSNKFERDINLLLDGIKDEPNNVRYYFYLANSYHDSGKFEEAINTYLKRISLGGWDQEVWYSYYRIGLCYKNMGKMADAIFYWLQGYDYLPDRLEAIYEIVYYYRINSRHKLCKQFYNMAKEILNKNEKRDHYLFLHNDIYTYKFDFEYTIFSSYLGVKNINDEIVTIFNNSNDQNDLNCLLSNMKFYKDILTQKTKLILDNKYNANLNGEIIPFLSSSSCLIKCQQGYKLNIRYVNYYIQDNGSYINCDKHIITINKYVEFDNQFNVKREVWMDLLFDNRLYIGTEDVKIFYDNYEEKIKYIGTGYHLNNKLGLVSGNYDINNTKMEINELTQNFTETSCEKNWVFVDYNDDVNIIYDWYPMRIGKLENNELKIHTSNQMPKIFSRVRGSTCGFNYVKKLDENNNGNITINITETEIWFVGHIVSYENPRHYYHIISVFDSNMNLLRYSAPFKFEGEPIEYCLSIIVEDDNVLMNYSSWDRTTRIGVYDKKYIDSIVKYN